MLISRNCKVLILICTSSLLVSSNSDSEYFLDIVHTMGINSAYEPFDYKMSRCGIDESKCLGGISRIAGFVYNYRRDHGQILLLDGGNFRSKNVWYDIHHGKAATAFLNHMKYDAMVLGCSDFSFFSNFTDELQIPLLFSNLDSVASSNSMKRLLKTDPIIVNVNSVPVGIIGFTRSCPIFRKINLVALGDSVIQEKIDYLKGHNVFIIILVSHADFETNKGLALKFPEIDLVVGGERNFLYSGSPPTDEQVDGNYPHVVRKRYSTNLVVCTGLNGKYVGAINIKYNSEGHSAHWEGNPVLMDKSVGKDITFDDEYSSLAQPIRDMYSKRVGSSSEVLEGAGTICQTEECSLGNLLCDAIADEARSLGEPCHTCAMQSSAIRDNIAEGQISLHDVVTALPLNMSVEAVYLNGSALWKLFEFSIKNIESSDLDGRFLQVSGIRVKYNFKTPKFVEQIWTSLCPFCRTYKVVDYKRMYCVLMSSFITTGGEGYDWMAGEVSRITPLNMTDTASFIRYLSRYSPVYVRMKERLMGFETFPNLKRKSRALSLLNDHNCGWFFLLHIIFYMLYKTTISVNLLLT